MNIKHGKYPKRKSKNPYRRAQNLAGRYQQNGTKFFGVQEMDSRARCGGFIPQNRDDFSSLWVMRFRGVVGMLLFFRRLLSHARKIIQGAIPMADKKQT